MQLPVSMCVDGGISVDIMRTEVMPLALGLFVGSHVLKRHHILIVKILFISSECAPARRQTTLTVFTHIS
jgi:hypothetical protein